MLGGQTRISHDATHRECVHWIVSWNREDANAIGHYNVLALTHDAKASFLQRSDSDEMIDARNLRHGLYRDSHFAHIFTLNQIVDRRKIFSNSNLDVLKCFLFSFTLRPATGQTGT